MLSGCLSLSHTMVVLFSACTGGVIELSEFTLFLRHQAKEAERKLKVPSLSPLYIYSLSGVLP